MTYLDKRTTTAEPTTQHEVTTTSLSTTLAEATNTAVTTAKDDISGRGTTSKGETRTTSIGPPLPCFLAHKDYDGENLNIGCTKKGNVAECQNLCQDTQRCAKFSYIMDTYNGQHGTAARKNCCLKANVTMELIDMADVTSGPRFCPPGKSRI